MSVHVFAQYLESTKWTSSEHYIFKLTKIRKLSTDENEKNHQGETKHSYRANINPFEKVGQCN